MLTRALFHVDHAIVHVMNPPCVNEVRRHGAAMVMPVDPISLRYALDYRTYPFRQSHAHQTCASVPVDGPIVACNVNGNPPGKRQPARKLTIPIDK